MRRIQTLVAASVFWAAFQMPASFGGASEAAAESAPINWTDTSYKSKDARGGSLEQGEEHMSPPLLFALINFALLVILLVWKAGPAVSSYLQQKHRTIRDALDDSAKLRRDAEAQLRACEEKTAKLDGDIAELMASLRKDAENERMRMLSAAQEQAASIEADAHKKIAADLARARQDIEREVVTAAVAAAERILRNKIATTDQNALFEQFVAELKSGQQQQARLQ